MNRGNGDQDEPDLYGWPDHNNFNVRHPRKLSRSCNDDVLINNNDNIVKYVIRRETDKPLALRSFSVTSIFENLKLHHSIRGHQEATYCLTFDVTGRRIVTGSDDGLVKIWQTENAHLLQTIRMSASKVTNLAVNKDNTLLAVGDCAGLIKIFCLRALVEIFIIKLNRGDILSVIFSNETEERHFYLITTYSGFTDFWKFRANDDGSFRNVSNMSYRCNVSTINTGKNYAALSSGGSFLATGSDEAELRIYQVFGVKRPAVDMSISIKSHTHEKVPKSKADIIDSLAWANDDLKLACASSKGHISLWSCTRYGWTKAVLGDQDIVGNVTTMCWNKTNEFVVTDLLFHTYITI